MRETKIRIDATSDAYLLNRYVAFVHQQIYNQKGTLAENIPIEEKYSYQIQWKNIKADCLGFVKNPFAVSPRIAYSLAAFFFILLGRHSDAIYTAFYVGAIAFDAAAQTSHSGEPGTITWEHTVGSGSDRLIAINVTGLSGLNPPLWDGLATTAIVTQSPTRAAFYLNPDTGAADCTADGGNIKVGGSVSFSGVAQYDPIGASSSTEAGGTPWDSSLTTEAANSMRVDVLGTNRDDNTEPTSSLDAGTVRCNDIVAHNQFRVGLYVYTNPQASAGADTYAWTIGGFNGYIVAYEVKESVGVNVRVAADADDNFYRQNSGGTPTLSDNANDIPVGLFDANQTAMGGQMRFLSVAVPAGATITTAYLSITSSGSDTADTVNSRIRGKDVDDATIDTTTGGFEAPPFTTAVVSWDAIEDFTDGIIYLSPEIKTVIQEIIDRGGWTSGNDIVLTWDDMEKRSTQTDNTLRRARSYNNDPLRAPMLHIEYTGGGGGGTVAVNSRGLLGVGT